MQKFDSPTPKIMKNVQKTNKQCFSIFSKLCKNAWKRTETMSGAFKMRF